MKRHPDPPLAVGILLCLALALACSDPAPPPPPETAPAAAAPVRGTIVAMGTSLTEGLGVAEAEAFPALLEKKLRAAGFPWRVVNAGVSGETSSGALSRLEWVMRLKPDIAIVETGANDGLRGIDPQLIARNLTAIVEFFKSRGVTVVVAGMQMVRNLGQDYTRRFAAVYPEVARRAGVMRIPFLLEGVAARPELNQADGIHPTAAGQQAIAETVFPYVVKAIEERSSQSGDSPPSDAPAATEAAAPGADASGRD